LFYHDLTSVQTPNHCLQPNDIPPRRHRNLSNDVTYPSPGRYTLQWINPDESVAEMIQNNCDAAFKKYTRKPKPSELLLHYNYGAAAVKWWGHGTEVLHNRFQPPRPSGPVLAPSGPSRGTHNRSIAIHKRDEARMRGTEEHGSSGTGKHGAVQVANKVGYGAQAARGASARYCEDELDEQVMWDEDDVMLYLWGNSQAAKERHRKKVQENTHRMERWRDGLPPVFI
jgi:hypothetical protein